MHDDDDDVDALGDGENCHICNPLSSHDLTREQLDENVMNW